VNIIFGSGGFAKEVDWLIHDIYDATGIDYRANHFVVQDNDISVGKVINGVRVISESEAFAANIAETINCFIAVGEPNIKEKIVNKIKSNIKSYIFPVLIHPDVTYDKRPGKVLIDEGSIICSKSVLTTDIHVKSFVVINLGCTIGHDSTVGSYSTLSPGAHISGTVHIAERVYIGSGAVIIQNHTVCGDCLIGAGSLVSKDILIPGTYVGIPARKIK
jgi:sugar O-acyltransferase (sialic acid O-acetyltransferase NeuD family)